MKQSESEERFGAALLRVLLEGREFVTSTGNVAWGQFAQALGNHAGVSYASLHKAVAGEREPTIRLMEAVAGFLGLEPSYFAEYRLARARENLDPRTHGGGVEGLQAALDHLRRLGASKSRTPA